MDPFYRQLLNHPNLYILQALYLTNSNKD